jgi:transposase
MSPSDSLPTDLDGLRALLLAERAHHAEELERLTAIIKELQRHRFGRRAERLDPEQLALALEDVEQTLAAADAAAENDTTAQKQATPRRRHINRGALPSIVMNSRRFIQSPRRRVRAASGELRCRAPWRCSY